MKAFSRRDRKSYKPISDAADDIAGITKGKLAMTTGLEAPGESGKGVYERYEIRQ